MNLKGCLTKIGCFGQKADSSVFIVNCMSCNRLQSTRGFWLLIHLMYWLKQQLFGHTIIESHGWPIQKLDVNIAFYVFLFRETVCMSRWPSLQKITVQIMFLSSINFLSAQIRSRPWYRRLSFLFRRLSFLFFSKHRLILLDHKQTLLSFSIFFNCNYIYANSCG